MKGFVDARHVSPRDLDAAKGLVIDGSVPALILVRVRETVAARLPLVWGFLRVDEQLEPPSAAVALDVVDAERPSPDRLAVLVVVVLDQGVAGIRKPPP